MLFIAEVGGYFDGHVVLVQPLTARPSQPQDTLEVDKYGQSEHIKLSFATYNSDGHPHVLIYVQAQHG